MKIERITRPGVDVDPDTARYMDETHLMQDWNDKMLDLILNGPTLNGFKKDEVKAMLRQTYGALKKYEEIGPLASPLLNDAAAVVAMAFSALYPDKAYEAQITPTIQMPDGEQACGCTTFPSDEDELPLVEISGQLPIMHLPEILAHELAHVATGTINEHGPEWEAAFIAIHSKYDEISVELFGELPVEDGEEGITHHKIGDGGIIAMPLKANVPEPTHDDWKPTTCPVCGAECWETGIAREAMAAEPELRKACTTCALKAGIEQQGGDRHE